MNGSEFIVGGLKAAGVDVVFANPGTSEMQLVAALDHVEGMRPVLCLFEGVCSGAADGFFRMAGLPAATLLHLGPGLSNASANLHNAKRAGSAIINLIGDHARDHQALDAPLASDIDGLAAPVSHTVIRLSAPEALDTELSLAITASHGSAGGVVSVIVAADIAWSEGGISAFTAPEIAPPTEEDPQVIGQAADALETLGAEAMLCIGGDALADEEALASAAAIKAKTGCRIVMPTFNRRVRRGAGLPRLERSPYLAEQAVPFFESVRAAILLSVPEPVAFFAYPGRPGRFLPEAAERISLNAEGGSSAQALKALAAAIGVGADGTGPGPKDAPDAPAGELSPVTIAASIRRHLPAEAVIVDEGVTSSGPVFVATRDAPAHDWLDLTGGSIGYGLPAALGAAIAVPDRKVVCLEGDGSGMYTAQALWSMAREGVDVTVVLYNNAAYEVLQMEMRRTGSKEIGDKAMETLQIGNPVIDFADLAASMGVQGVKADSAEAFDAAFADAMASRGPVLIDARIK